ncbi:MAG: hypothetical protein J1E37_06130 [Prevotella sp.]|nr:hypothetical protein [Prevotella sp.]
MKKIEITKILEYYDVPQLFIAEDAFGMKYLCLLYDIAEDGELKFIGVTVSFNKLNDFIKGHIDLLDMFMYPEKENSLFTIRMKEEGLFAEEYNDIPNSSMLPEKGYFYNACLNDALLRA